MIQFHLPTSVTGYKNPERECPQESFMVIEKVFTSYYAPLKHVLSIHQDKIQLAL